MRNLTFAAPLAAQDINVAPVLSTLWAMQWAWIPFRDAKRDAEYAKWGSGSMRNIAASGCLMQTNAEQTIQLWAMYDAFR